MIRFSSEASRNLAAISDDGNNKYYVAGEPQHRSLPISGAAVTVQYHIPTAFEIECCCILMIHGSGVLSVPKGAYQAKFLMFRTQFSTIRLHTWLRGYLLASHCLAGGTW